SSRLNVCSPAPFVRNSSSSTDLRPRQIPQLQHSNTNRKAAAGVLYGNTSTLLLMPQGIHRIRRSGLQRMCSDGKPGNEDDEEVGKEEYPPGKVDTVFEIFEPPGHGVP